MLLDIRELLDQPRGDRMGFWEFRSREVGEGKRVIRSLQGELGAALSEITELREEKRKNRPVD